MGRRRAWTYLYATCSAPSQQKTLVGIIFILHFTICAVSTSQWLVISESG